MTRTEQAELQELGMTPERLAENQAKVAAILHGDKPQSDPYDALERCDKCEELKLDVKQTRYGKRCPECAPKRRSDAGVPRTPRTKPSEQAPGVLTREQVAHIDKLRLKMRDTENNLAAATDANLEAERAYYAYMTEITAK